MKRIQIIFFLLLFCSLLSGQDTLKTFESAQDTLKTEESAQDTLKISEIDHTAYGQSLYWRALNLSEKKVFVHAYLYRTYEIQCRLEESKKDEIFSDQFKKKFTEPLFDLFSGMDEIQKEEFVSWIDIFYQNDFNKEKPFFDALIYAGGKHETKKRSLLDIFKEVYK
ncbi:MAG: hypothetical protein PHW79_08190 [Candidatus Marinimicrobia bacterium]|nr:hypothetical protein [Candidatus Neomarinimicrobiota bacterium]